MIASALLVIINFEGISNGSVILDMNQIVESLQELHFYTDYVGKFKEFGSVIEEVKNSQSVWNSITSAFKLPFKLIQAVCYLLMNSVANISQVLLWLVSLGFSNI